MKFQSVKRAKNDGGSSGRAPNKDLIGIIGGKPNGRDFLGLTTQRLEEKMNYGDNMVKLLEKTISP